VLYGARRIHPSPSRVGFIVGKNVGNAVTRNLVKRRLRAISAEFVAAYPGGYDVVVRALPAAADSDWSALHKDFTTGIAAVLRRLGGPDVPEREGRVS
jgi:ribonuclease P protein component